MNDITLTNIGPLARTIIPIPAAGGVTVLRGRNGAGKSIALDAIASTVSGNGKGKPPLKDLASRGEVSAFGATLTVGKSVRRRGELEVALLEGRISVADLVDPQIQDPARADAARIRALISLSGASFCRDDFIGFPELALDGIDLTGDPLAVISTVRQRLNQLAVASEKCAASESASARALRDSVGTTESVASFPDPDELNARLEAAIRHESALQQAAQDAAARQVQAEQARTALAGMDSPHIGVATRTRDDAADVLFRRQTAVINLEVALQDARNEEIVAESALKLAQQEMDSAVAISAVLEKLQTQIDAGSAPGPSPDQVDVARAKIESARTAIEAAAAARRAADTLTKADAHETEAETHAAEAAHARQWAKYTDELLSEQVAAVPACPLTVVDGRLVAHTRRGPTYYSELSAGERWRMAMDVAIQAVGDRGLIIIPQEAWEGLDSANRAAIHQQAQAAGVTVLTAECSDDETVTAETYGLEFA